MPPRRSPPHDLRVLPHRPHLERWFAGILIAAVSIAVGVGYGYGRYESADERERAVARLDSLTARHLAVVAERDEFQQALSDERLASEMDRSSGIQVRQTLSDQAARITELEDQLRSYRQLMANGGELDQIEIAEFELVQRLDGPGVRFRMLLVQPADRGDEIAGHLEVRVRGAQAGNEEILSGTALGASFDAIPFRFRYFQNVAGEFELPEGFVPEGVDIVARAEGTDGFELQRQFNWQLREV
ncbi:MAG TPA: DUF6776 family protein [Pseudomonadales bacterium]|nr:DUF6776 family protein [Pseudomonadales bacterium]